MFDILFNHAGGNKKIDNDTYEFYNVTLIENFDEGFKKGDTFERATITYKVKPYSASVALFNDSVSDKLIGEFDVFVTERN